MQIYFKLFPSHDRWWYSGDRPQITTKIYVPRGTIVKTIQLDGK